MKRNVQQTGLAAAASLVFSIFSTPAAAQSIFATGADADVTAEGLQRIDPLIMEAAWVRPDFDLSHYSKILVVPTAVHFRDIPKRQTNARSRINTVDFPLPDARKQWIRDLWERVVSDEFSQEEIFDRTDGVGPDVLVVQGLLVDVVSHIPPETFGSSYTVVADPWSVVIVLELRDAATVELIARTIDHQVVEGNAELSEIWYRTEGLARDWAQVLTDRLQQLAELGGRPSRVPAWAQQP